jgi:tripartite-type tricarboxylate transporter receptor subunit TctC
MMRLATCLTALGTGLLALAPLASAQSDYPNRPVRLIIPFPPGGSNDVVGRMVATKLGEKMGKQVVVDNRAGAGGVVGTEVAIASPADGYTLLVISLAHAVNPWLYKLKYDPLKSITPIALVGAGPNVLAVTPALPVKSVKELLDYAKANPGKLNMAHAGVGSFQHLGSSLFLVMTKLDIVQVPFKGGGPAMIDVIAGHSQVTMGSLVQTTGHIKSGKLRALGVGGRKRAAILPDLPTIAEAGVPGYEANNWWGIVGPAGLPPAIVEKVRADVGAVQDTAELKGAFEKEGAEIVKMGPADFTKFIAAELVKWEKVVKEANIKAQ